MTPNATLALPASATAPRPWWLGRNAFSALICLAPWLVGPFLTASRSGATLLGIEGPGCLLTRLLPAAGCPGCGLTRGVGLALHGDLAGALAVHPAVLLLLTLALAGAVLHLRAARRGFETAADRRARTAGRATLGLALAATWIVRLAGGTS